MTLTQPAPTSTATPTNTAQKIDRLSAASLRRIIDPDVDLPGALNEGAVLPPELLSVAGLDLDLTSEQQAVLSREEVASIVASGLRFESILMAGFCLQLATAPDLTDARVVYALHEIGEETRHSRLFSRLLSQLRPRAKHPLERPFFQFFERRILARIIRRPALLDVLVLAGEEIPDLIQKLAVENEATDPFLREVNRYHRQEEARHLAYARIVVGEHHRDAGPIERLAVRHVAPRIVGDMFRFLVHPGVYEVVGLPGWATWRAANRTPERVELRYTATRPVLRALLDAGVMRRGHIPRPWRQLCGVDKHAAQVN